MPKLKKATSKKLLRAELIIFSVLLLGIIGTAFGFLHSNDSLRNVFTIGKNVSEITEEWTPPNRELRPGETCKKVVRVSNTGTVPCYVRVFAEIAEQDTRDKIDVDYNTDSWTKHDDGYYYYNKAINPGEKTEPLLTRLKVKGTESVGRSVGSFSMICYEETVQSEGVSIGKAFDNAK